MERRSPGYILYNRTLTALERPKVNSYLGINYGITQFSPAVGPQTITSSGTVIWQGTANAADHNNVAGIGRETGRRSTSGRRGASTAAVRS